MNLTPELLTALGGAFVAIISALISFRTQAQSAKRDIIITLNDQITRMDERIKSLEFKIAEQDKTIDAQDGTMRMLRSRIAELESQNMLKDKRIKELEEEIARLKLHETLR